MAFLTSKASSLFLIYEAATKVHPLSLQKSICALSFSVMAALESRTLGIFKLLPGFISVPVMILSLMIPSDVISVTVESTIPSSNSTLVPMLRSL
jgi:hypothetical protein